MLAGAYFYVKGYDIIIIKLSEGIFMNLHSTFEGKYFFGFFIIWVNGTLKISREKAQISSVDYPKYFHEYIHFLQNISTTYCLRNTHYYLGHLLSALYLIQKNKNNEVLIPLNLESIDKAELSKDIIAYSEGDYDDYSYEEYDSISVIKIEQLKEKMDFELFGDNVNIIRNNYPIPITLKLKNDIKEEVKIFNFGACAIKESMASLVEEVVFGRKRTKMTLQYDIVRLISKVIIGYELDKKILIELCEVVLMYDNPTYMFISYLFIMKNENLKSLKFGDVLQFFEQRANIHYMIDYHRYMRSTLKSLKDLLPEGFKYLFEYIDKIILTSYKFRKKKKNRLLITRLVCGGELKRKKYNKWIQKNFQIPVLIDNNGKIFFPKLKEIENFNFMILLIYYAFYQFFIFGKTECPLQNICKNLKIARDIRLCEKKPWENELNIVNNNFCYYKYIWKCWNLDNYNFFNKNS